MAPLQGVVADESTLTPVGSATISVIGAGTVARTDEFGSFSFQDPPEGRVVLRAVAPGLSAVTQEVEVREGAVVFVQFLLPPVEAVLSRLLVEADRPDPARGTDPVTAADLLALQVPTARLNYGEVGGVASRPIRLRGQGSIQLNSDALLFIDGVQVSGLEAGFDRLREIPAWEVESIRVLRGPAASTRYANAADGVIEVITRRSRAER